MCYPQKFYKGWTNIQTKCGSASRRVNLSTIELLRGHSKLNNSQYTYISLTEEPKWLQNSSFITNFRNQPHFNKIAKLYSNKYTDHFCGSFPDIYYMPYGFCEIQTTLERSYKFSHAFNHLQKNEFLSSEMPHRTHIIFLTWRLTKTLQKPFLPNFRLNCRIPCHLFACHWIRIASKYTYLFR